MHDRVSPKLKVVKGDKFIKDASLRFDQQTIQMPERFSPHPEFLRKHAKHFGFI